jgi:tetratricopeptide (TPR) repeat protein
VVQIVVQTEFATAPGSALAAPSSAFAVDAMPPSSARAAMIATNPDRITLISTTLPIVGAHRCSVSCLVIMATEPTRSIPGGTTSRSNAGRTLGERVRTARHEAGLSQAQLAGDELTKGFISQIESGLVRPSIRSLQHIAAKLGRPLDYFVGDEPLAATKRATFHRLAAEAAAERQEWPAAEAESVAGLAAATDGSERATFLRLLASAALNQGRREDAFDRVTEGLALVDVAKQPFDVARLLYVRGLAYGDAGQLVASTETFESVRDIIERYEILDPRLRARVAVALGTTYRRLGRTTKAIASYESALATASRANELKLAAQGLMGIAVSHYDAGDLDAAITSYERALDLFERIADTGFELHVRQSLASIHFQQGNISQARDLADRTIARSAEVGDEHWGAVAQVVRARVLLSDGDADEAKGVARQAERALAAVGDQIQRAHALRVVAVASEARGETAEADRAFKQAIELLSSIDDRADLSLAASEYSKLLRARGSIDEAFAMLELAHTRR